jgi:hypothetical protein
VPWKGLDYVLVDLASGEPVAGLEPPGLLQGIGFDFHFKPVVVRAGSDVVVAHLLLFFRDAECQHLAWGMECMPTISFVHDLFTFKGPLLKLKPNGARSTIKADDGLPLVSIAGIWRDSDIARGVHRQFVVEDRDHPLFIHALWSAFVVSCGYGGYTEAW